jgi:hypothetical protein
MVVAHCILVLLFEHKWMRVEPEKEEGNAAAGSITRRCLEFYRYDKDGVQNQNSLYACRLFLTKQ